MPVLVGYLAECLTLSSDWLSSAASRRLRSVSLRLALALSLPHSSSSSALLCAASRVDDNKYYIIYVKPIVRRVVLF